MAFVGPRRQRHGAMSQTQRDSKVEQTHLHILTPPLTSRSLGFSCSKVEGQLRPQAVGKNGSYPREEESPP